MLLLHVCSEEYDDCYMLLLLLFDWEVSYFQNAESLPCQFH